MPGCTNGKKVQLFKQFEAEDNLKGFNFIDFFSTNFMQIFATKMQKYQKTLYMRDVLCRT